jgi:membrane-associated phospholipid phosphatase
LFFNDLNLRKYIFPGIAIGGLVPILLPIFFFFFGAWKKDKVLQAWAGLLGQSAFLGWFTSSLIKSFTGRIQPNTHDLVTNISGSFNFGFWEHGIFWGWPSSHTTVVFSVATAICIVLLKGEASLRSKIIIFVVILFAFYVGVSVSVSIHWFSDFLMGVILGIAVGREVGNRFKNLLV